MDTFEQPRVYIYKISVSHIMKNPEYEINITDKIKARLLEQEGFEEIVSEEAWAAEKNKGKKLNKPFRTSGGPKKFSVYVKNEKGNVVKVNFGDPNMEIKRDDPARRKSFRARHGCDNPGPKTKAKYWSCKMWSKKSVTQVTKGSEEELEQALIEYMDESDAGKNGLWDNIRKKKKREGKKYKAAKPGDKDRPSKKAWEKAQSAEYDEKNFKPHKMYDPKTGKGYDAKTYQDHLKTKRKRKVIKMEELSRRAFAGQVAKSYLGVSALIYGNELFSQQVRAPTARHVIFLNMSGGMTHIDTFDPKPENKEVMGETKAINTSADGIQIGNWLPKTANQMHLTSLVRSVNSNQGAHDQANYLLQTVRKTK